MTLHVRIGRAVSLGLTCGMLLWTAQGSSHAQQRPIDQGIQKASPPRQVESKVGGVQMQKFVSEQATFVVYVPKGWRATEGGQQGFRTMSITDPAGSYEVAMFCGTNPAGNDPVALAKRFVNGIGSRFPDLQVRNALLSPDRSRVAFDGTYSQPQRGRKEFRSWVTVSGGEFSYSSIEAPEGQLAAARPMLLTILSNIRVLKGAFSAGGTAAPSPVIVSLVPYRLSDGSASFQMPQGWKCKEFGKGTFAAGDPAGQYSFIVGSVDMITPQLGVRVPGTIVAPYQAPSRAWQMLTGQMGLATNMQFDKVFPRQDMAQQMGQVYTAGPLTVEEMVYTFDSRTGQRSRGYTFGFSFGSRTGTHWSFRHLTVTAPANQFEAFLPNFAAMLQSYKINDQWAQNYIAQGIQRLRQLQQQTSAMVTRNASEIRQMMQAAYDERQRSQDYIDYQRTQYIRGESDWISDMEGGTVYHTDAWGTRNTATGETWEGKPYDYYNYTGQNPKYNEQMQPVDSRELYEYLRRNQ